jgi:hypothetical protein
MVLSLPSVVVYLNQNDTGCYNSVMFFLNMFPDCPDSLFGAWMNAR